VISYIIYIVIILILIFVSIIAIKAISRGIDAKKNLSKDNDIDKNNQNKENKKN
tara:strand:+ start:282 stop:443 length:162 start_codon:yes stop_codon:yes gene_type:complete